MPVVKLYPNGLTGGTPPASRPRKPPKRGNCEGWTVRTSRGNTRFLYSVRSKELPFFPSRRFSGERCFYEYLDNYREPAPLIGLAGSLTVGDCPASHEDWKRLRESLLVRLRRKGLYRLHWLTEWQKRGVPHLHFAGWFDPEIVFDLCAEIWMPPEALSALIKADWLMLSSRYRSSNKGQDIKPIADDIGWLQYLSKHASRGAAHYQRASSTIPQGWQKTGRMWGHLGEFPTREPLGLELDLQAWFQFRRIVRAWRLAKARIQKSPKSDPGREFLEQRIRRRRIESARHMLRCGNRPLSEVRGVSEWIPLDLGLSISHWLAKNGADIDSIG